MVMKALLEAGLLNGDCLTVTARRWRRTSPRSRRRMWMEDRPLTRQPDPSDRRHHDLAWFSGARSAQW